jgi:hypothetical protein
MMIYHSQFGNKGGCVGFHRDNGLLSPNGTIGHVGYNEDENSQIKGSSVITFSIGAPMIFQFKKPPGDLNQHEVRKKDHVTDENLRVLLCHGDVLVMDPRDDERFVHGACFQNSEKKHSSVRIVFVFRWLSKKNQFYEDPIYKFAMVCHGSNVFHTAEDERGEKQVSKKQKKERQKETKDKKPTASDDHDKNQLHVVSGRRRRQSRKRRYQMKYQRTLIMSGYIAKQI